MATGFGQRDEVVCVAPTGDWCGEGVLWHPTERAVYWTDINRFLIHRWTAKDDAVRSWFFDQPVTCVLLSDEDGTLVVVLGSGVLLWKPATDTRSRLLFHLPGWPEVRANDAGVDPQGFLWVGSMRNNVNADGSSGEAGGTDGKLFRMDPDGTMSERLTGIGIANTIVWSPDGQRFYFADSLANQISTYPFTASPQGGLGEPQAFLNGFPRGLPDGSAMDADGFLWNCRFGGGCVVRVAPDGSIDRVIEVPAKNVTNCTFGGENLRTLYITTAGLETTPGDRLAGSLFALRTNVAGLPSTRFRARG